MATRAAARVARHPVYSGVVNERMRRQALNEALFREVNERINDAADRFGLQTFDIVCECDMIDCSERLEIAQDAYEQLRADPTLYAVAPGHDAPGVESVVAHEKRYDVVRKHDGEPAEIARATAPRE